MDTRTFKADTMIEALQMVQNELGPDAVVLSAREVPVGPLWKKRNVVELVAVPPQQAPQKAPAPALQKPAIPLSDDASQIEWVKEDQPAGGTSEKKSRLWQPVHMTREEAKSSGQAAPLPVKVPTPPPAKKEPVNRDALAKEVAAREMAAQAPAAPKTPETREETAHDPNYEIPKGLKKYRQVLLNQGVDESFLDRTLKLLIGTINPLTLQDEDTSRKYLAQILEAELRVLPNLALQPPAQTVCLVGPSGAGKTSATAKLAVFYGQQMGKRVCWICADTIRTGAIAQGRAYAEALGVKFKLTYTPDELKESIFAEKSADLILIDTPGYNAFLEEEMVELGSLLTEIPARHTFLVAPATAKENDIMQEAAALGIFGLDGLIVTKLDETNSYGNIFNLARKTHIPIGFFGAGKEATDYFQTANSARLVSALFGKGWLK